MARLTDARSTLDAWRESGADRFAPARFRLIEALDRRAAAHGGEARRVIDARLATLLDAYARDLAHAEVQTAETADPVRGPLAALVDHIASHASPVSAGYPELASLDHFREIWSRLSAERQLLQSLAQVPGNAGPLNSSSLVHRALSLMRDVSPAYLQQFLAYVDALSWVEQISAGGGVVAAKDAPRGGNARRNSRGKAR